MHKTPDATGQSLGMPKLETSRFKSSGDSGASNTCRAEDQGPTPAGQRIRIRGSCEMLIAVLDSNSYNHA